MTVFVLLQSHQQQRLVLELDLHLIQVEIVILELVLHIVGLELIELGEIVPVILMLIDQSGKLGL
jgi:hypothetical protein